MLQTCNLLHNVCLLVALDMEVQVGIAAAKYFGDRKSAHLDCCDIGMELHNL